MDFDDEIFVTLSLTVKSTSNYVYLSVLISPTPNLRILYNKGFPSVANEKRKARWGNLNAVLEKILHESNIKRRKTNVEGSTDRLAVAYSAITWDHVKDIFGYTAYIQAIKKFESTDAVRAFDILKNYLSIVHKSFKDFTVTNEATRLHLISPVLMCVVSLIPGAFVEVEQDLKGDFVKAKGHFEFVIRVKNKYVCILEAKKEDFAKGMAQSLVGCEVAAELDNCPRTVVYAIVTNVEKWVFIKNADDKIEKDDSCCLVFEDGIPKVENLLSIAGKIYSILNEESEKES